MRKRINSMLLVIFLLLILLAFFINHSDNTTSYTVVGETHITSNTTWNASASPYYIEGNVTVDFGWNLTIEAGTEVRFNGPFSLYIEGELFALGNESDMITFTSNSTSMQWHSIQVNASGYAKIKYSNITNALHAINLTGSDENEVQNNEISNNHNGIYLESSKNNTISDNHIHNNGDKGLFLTDSSFNLIKGNNISNNNWHGIHFYLNCENNIILDNDIRYNIRGVYFYFCDSNEILYNRIISNWGDGIFFSNSDNNYITNNNLSNNCNLFGSGINLSSSSNNHIYHNTLIDNLNQAYDDEITNEWDDGYPYGGNFWSDYDGVDLKKGKNQDVPGSDGIGDTNYTIDSDSVDRYPLINISRDIAPFLINLDFPLNNSFVKEGAEILFDILVKNISEVNYSLNYGSNITMDPYNITASSSSGWVEGENRLDVFVWDTNSNLNSSWFSFVFDSTKPIIELISPSNGSVIDTKGIIDISIIEPNINSAIFSLNNGSWENLLFPYDLNTSTWPEGNYWIDIHVDDLAGNENSTFYVFTVDTTPPSIFFNYPANNSYIKPGEEINLTISDMHLNSSSIYYTVSGGGSMTFSTPYLIDTSTWDDGKYYIEIFANDTLSHESFRSYNVTIDSIPPSVVLNSPQNNSVIRAGIPINFSAYDDNPFMFNYFINMGGPKRLLPPYNINATLFYDGIKMVNVNVTDYAGNYNELRLIFTIDSTDPEITLLSPLNQSTIRSGVIIEFDISDINIEFANYSVNGENFSDLLSSMRIETIDWAPGLNSVEVFAMDRSGNNVSASFTFYVDNTPPQVVSSNPSQDKKGVSVDSTIEITFNELMDKISFEDAISIIPYINFTIKWSADNLTLIITPVGNLSNVTTYTVTINTNATDIVGNPLVTDFVLKFTTGPSEEFSIWMMFIIIVAAIIVIISLAMFAARRRKKTKEAEGEEEEDEFEDVGKEEGEEISEEEDQVEKKKEEESAKGEKKDNERGEEAYEEGTGQGKEPDKEKGQEELKEEPEEIR